MEQGKGISILICIIIIIIYSISVKQVLLACILFSILLLFIDKFIKLSKFFDKDDKDKIDYRKYLFILIYIYLVVYYSGLNLVQYLPKKFVADKLPKLNEYLSKNLDVTDDNINIILFGIFIVFIIIPSFIFTFLSSDYSPFQKGEYIIYNLYIFSFILIFNTFISNRQEFEIIKMYLNIITLLGFIIFVLKPLILELSTADLLSKKISQIKWSNYYYFNKNIKNYDNSKNYNKRYFNSLMNYMIINIILIGIYLGLVYLRI